jgi:hypothetical protein
MMTRNWKRLAPFGIMTLAVCLELGKPGTAAEVVDVCEVVADPAKFAGMVITVRGILGGFEGLSVSSRERCPGRPIGDEGGVPLWGPSLPQGPRTAEEEVLVSAEGEIIVDQSRPGRFGLQVGLIRVESIIRRSSLSVCELFQKRNELNGKKVEIRGLLRKAQEGIYLLEKDCAANSAGVGGRRSTLVWIEGWANPGTFVREGKLADQLVAHYDLEVIVTVNGVFRSESLIGLAAGRVSISDARSPDVQRGGMSVLYR